jgi:hypothetical protein
MKLLTITSISPSHHNGDVQKKAVASWPSPKVAIQTEEECLSMSGYDIQMASTHRTARRTMKAPYVMISAMIDYARALDADALMLINSDIELHDPDNVLPGYVEESVNGLIFANRHDHNGDYDDPQRYAHGFDVFIIHRNYFDILPQSMFCMGQTWWDYWIPYRFIQAKIPITLVKEPIFLHQRHPVQYNQKEWERMTEHFRWMEGYHIGRPQQVTNDVYRLIKHHAR